MDAIGRDSLDYAHLAISHGDAAPCRQSKLPRYFRSSRTTLLSSDVMQMKSLSQLTAAASTRGAQPLAQT